MSKGTGPAVAAGDDLQIRLRKIKNGYLLLSGGEQWYTKSVHELAAAMTVAAINWGNLNGDDDDDDGREG